MSAVAVESRAFASFEAMAARHDEMLATAEAAHKSLGEVTDQDILAFLDRAAETGAVIADPRERRTARSIVNFWGAELITRGKVGSKWSPPALAAARLETADAPTPSPPAPNDADLERSRALVRISAGARQWIASGRTSGWLLSGKALAEAEDFVLLDEDIRALVAASRTAKGTRQRLGLAALVLLCVFFGGLAGFAFVQRDEANVARDEANVARDEATKALAEVTAARDQAAVDAKAASDALQAAVTDAVQRNLAQQREVEKLQSALKEIAPLVREARDAGRIDASRIPEPLRPLIDALDTKSAAPQSILPADQSLVRGYDPHFLRPPSIQQKAPTGDADSGITIPLPSLSGPALAGAYNEGKPVDYVNFSLVISRARRMPALAAVNLRRTAIGSLLRTDAIFQYEPRVPRDAQPGFAAFHGTDIDRGHLVNAREIAWGPAFGTSPAETGRLAYTMINVMTNVTPQFNTFNQGVWFEAERYAREEFSGRSDRVTIFSGPVLRDSDPKIGGSDLKIPRHFWKVLVAANPDNPADLVVEAYLIPQFGEGDTKIDKVRFLPHVYRARVTDIEALTGLDFGAVVRSVDTRSWTAQMMVPPPRDTSRAALLVALAGQDNAARTTAVRDLTALLGDPATADSELRSLVERVVAMASADSFKTLPDAAKTAVLASLAAVPQVRWEQERWVDLRAAARRSVVDAVEALGGCAQGGGACTQIVTLKHNLGWSLAAGRMIYFVFAGLVREDASAIWTKLKALGWRIPAEPRRLSQAANANEVRHADSVEERAAAELLAADLRALGRSAVRAKKVTLVKPKTLEIWISI